MSDSSFPHISRHYQGSLLYIRTTCSHLTRFLIPSMTFSPLQATGFRGALGIFLILNLLQKTYSATASLWGPFSKSNELGTRGWHHIGQSFLWAQPTILSAIIVVLKYTVQAPGGFISTQAMRKKKHRNSTSTNPSLRFPHNITLVLQLWLLVTKFTFSSPFFSPL